MSAAPVEYVIGVDIGGTCTDCVVVDREGTITIGKAFSTPSDFSAGVLDAIESAAREHDTDAAGLLRRTRLFLHATTVAENAIIEGELAKGGLLVTRGFEDTLALMRGGYQQWSGRSEEEAKNLVYSRKPPPLVPRDMIRGIKERVDAAGQILAAAESAEIAAAVRELRERGAEAIGVCFLWSFLNPENEDAVDRTVKGIDPDLFFTASHDVAPILGEFERMQTVAFNIGLGPTVTRYLQSLEERLSERRYHGPVLVMQAYGGLLAVEEACKRPVGLIESGPVSGLVGSKALGDLLGCHDILGVDMGGTTFKAGVVSGGIIDYELEPMVLRYHYASPKMNVVSIGIAGGSVISLDPATAMPRIGPQSAGADPGPICYGFGGIEPTVTDADFLLGYLDERFFLGGRAQLERERTRQIFEETVARPLGMDVTEAAGEMCRLANSMILDLLHKLTVERGLDPRRYTIFSSGGTAGMHVTSFGPPLGVREIVIPYSAAVHGALGVVTSDIAYEEQLSRPMQLPCEAAVVNAIFVELEERVMHRLRADGFRDEDVAITKAIDMRYRRQVHVVTTPLGPLRALGESDVAEAVEHFGKLYDERFGVGSGYGAAGVEMVNFRLRGVGLLKKPELRAGSANGGDASGALVEERSAYFPSARRTLVARCYDSRKLHPGHVLEGPAIVWTPITTIVVNPGQTAEMDAYKNFRIRWDR